jgi:hypothetical protein
VAIQNSLNLKQAIVLPQSTAMSLDACIVIGVVSRLIYRKAVPASNALMYVLTDFGFEKTNRLENVFIGQPDRYEKIGN